MRVLVAGRLSRKVSDRDQTGFDSQEREAIRWAEYNGHTIVKVVADYKSGRSDMIDRKNLRPWVSDPEKISQYEAIVALKMDRLTRGDTRETRRLEQWADDHHKKLIIVSGAEYPAEGNAGIWWDFAKRQAHQEWLDISERYTRMQNYLRTADRPDGGKGYFVGRPPFGYRIHCAENCGAVKCRHHKILIPDEKTAPYALGMVKRYLDGDTLSSICQWLDSEGIKPSGYKASKHKLWQPKAVRDVLANPALIGRRANGAGKILKCDPIITDLAVWDRVQARLESNRLKPVRGAVRDEPALLTGIIFCARCDRVMHYHRTYNERLDGSRQYNYFYRCNGTAVDKSTCRNMVPLAEADGYVGSFMTEVIGPMELILRQYRPGRATDDAIEMVKADMAALDVEADDYLEQASELKAELNRLKALPAEPVGSVEQRTGVKMAEHWGSLDTDGARRKWLMAGQVKISAYMPPRRGKVPDGIPEPTAVTDDGRPFTFSVGVLLGAEWSVGLPVESY
jgi:DNA invertase Pin-like site-specific DNA recombinase